MSPEEKGLFEREALRLDEMADFHARLSKLESDLPALSRRVTVLQDDRRGHYNDDPMSGLFSPGMLTMFMLIALAPMVVDLVKSWKQQSTS